MNAPRIGSLFSGYGGLDMGVMAVVGGSVAWHVEFDDAPSKILAHHWPDVPNYGDVTTVDWAAVEPVDILTGGFPCQDVSLAGARRGLKDGTRSGLWSEFARAISTLKPRMVVIENVRGLLSATADGSMEPDPWGVGDGATRPVLNALGAVLGDLADLGYDTEWCGLRAADAGAPHNRFRVFIVAHSDGSGSGWRPPQPAAAQLDNAPIRSGEREPFANPRSDEPERRGGAGILGSAQAAGQADREERERVRDTTSDSGSVAPDSGSKRGHESDHVAGFGREGADGSGVADEHSPRPSGAEWGDYLPAIRRWETVTGRAAPPATNGDGKDGSHRLAAEFVEWMMGLPAGHITAPAIGLTRNQQLKAGGNGVVPQQAALALEYLLTRKEQAA